MIGVFAVPLVASADASTTATFAWDAHLIGTFKPTGIDCVTVHGCELLVSGSGTWTGDFTGTDTFTGVVYQQQNGQFVYTIQNAVLSGTVKHCGTGSALADLTGAVTGLQFPPAGGTGYATWRIVPGGTGQLAGASAGGTETDFFGANGQVTAHAQGTITCPVS